MYEKYIKRALGFTLSLCALIVLSPLLIILMALGAVFMRGNPFFTQKRPGKNEKIFKLVKFRTMDNRKGANGELLSDEVRLNKYGRFLRSTSLDELPELLNIIKGDMAVVGPRPLLVRDMIFMTEEQRKRHEVRPGLTGLAQANGRNNITWEKKLEYDLQYINSGITMIKDLKIILQTVGKVLKQSDTVREGTASDMDLGDWLMMEGKVDKETYEIKMVEAREFMGV